MTRAVQQLSSSSQHHLDRDGWANTLFGAGAQLLLERDNAVCWTGQIEGTAACLLIEIGQGAEFEVTERAFSFAARTGHAMVSVLINGGAETQGQLGAQLRAAHRLSGVLPHLAIESGTRSRSGRMRSAAADWSVAVSVEPELTTPHFSSEVQAASWARRLLSLIPANHTVAAPTSIAIERAPSQSTLETGDPLALIAELSSIDPVAVGSAAAGLQTGFACLGGHTVGYSASTVFIGDGEVTEADISSTARLIEFCDAYHIPFVALLDTPGLAGTDDAAANPLARTLAETATPTTVVITSRAGGIVGDLFTDRNLISGEILAWPGAYRAGSENSASLTVDRVIEPTLTADEIITTLSRWATVDEPLPERRRSVRAR